MKRFLSAFLALVMVFAMLATFSIAAPSVRPAVWVMVNGGYDFDVKRENLIEYIRNLEVEKIRSAVQAA